MTTNVERRAEDISERGYDPLDDTTNGDYKVSVERFDDTVAILTFTATVITIVLGFIFNL